MKAGKLRSVAERRHQPQPPSIPILASPQRGVENSPPGEQTEEETLKILDVSDCRWFIKLVVLIFGFSLSLIGSILYRFPTAPMDRESIFGLQGTDILVDPFMLKALVRQYAIFFGLRGFIVVIFASVCLVIRMKALSPSPSNLFWRNLGLSWTTWLRELIWSLLLVSLILGVVVFHWEYVLMGGGGRLHQDQWRSSILRS